MGWLGWLVAGVGSGGWWLVGGGWWLGMAGGSAKLLIGFDIYIYRRARFKASEGLL